MKIGFIIYDSLDKVTGGYLYDRKLVEHLRKQGDTVEILSLPWRNYPAHVMDNLHPPPWKAAHYDLIVQDELNHPSLIRWNKQQRGKTKIVSIVHHLRSSERYGTWQSMLHRKVEHDYLATVHAFVFNSETTRETVTKLLGCEPAHTVATPGGDRFAPSITPGQIINRAHEAGPLRLVHVGAVTRRKNLHTLLRALGYIKEGFALAVAGNFGADPAYLKQLKQQAEELGISKQVRWLGGIDDAELQTLLLRSQSLVGVSEYEGFGIAYLEGMSFGLPVIASTAGAAQEIVDHPRTGLLTDPDDAHALAQHIRAWMNDRYTLAEMSMAAHSRFAEMPTWHESCAKIRTFLLGLAQS